MVIAVDSTAVTVRSMTGSSGPSNEISRRLRRGSTGSEGVARIIDIRVALLWRNMDKNVCRFDRLGRVILATILLVVGYRNRNQTLGSLGFIAGSDLLATAVIQRCPVNSVLGIDTCGTE
jgi:hypothetical protein